MGGATVPGAAGRSRVRGRQRPDQRADRADLPVHGEAPVQQLGGVRHLGERDAVHEGHDERVAVAPGPGDERGLGRGGPADLPAQVAGVGVQHRVLVEQLDRMTAMQREHGRPGRLDPHELRHGQRLPGEQGQVVGGGVLPPGVQPVRHPGHGVIGLEPVRLGVHHGHALGVGPGRLGEGDRRVVRGNQQQGLEEVGHLIRVALDQPDLVRRDVGGQGRGDHGGVRVQHRHQCVRGEHLQRAGRQEVTVRVLGRQHLPGSRVRDHVGGGRHGGQPPGPVGRVVDDDAPARQFRPAHYSAFPDGPARHGAARPLAHPLGLGGGTGAGRCSLRLGEVGCGGRTPGGGPGQGRRGRQRNHDEQCGRRRDRAGPGVPHPGGPALPGQSRLHPRLAHCE